jgi:hypothetical protein
VTAYGGIMKRHRLDPTKPRQLTPEEERRLDETPIDYSDIPPLGDEFFSRAKRDPWLEAMTPKTPRRVYQCTWEGCAAITEPPHWSAGRI